MSLLIRLLRDADDTILHVCGSGVGSGPRGVILNPKTLNNQPVHSMRLLTAEFSIQQGLSLLLFWEGEDEHTFLLPLEGRGRLDFEWCGGLIDPRVKGWTGNIYLDAEHFTKGVKHFALVLEFSKQRG